MHNAIDGENLIWNPWQSRHVQTGVERDEAEALQAKGPNPDDPAVIAAIDLVRCELWLGT
jgi:hypothetical protein